MVGKSEDGRFLEGLRVLVVEDEVWIALDLEAAFVDWSSGGGTVRDP